MVLLKEGRHAKINKMINQDDEKTERMEDSVSELSGDIMLMDLDEVEKKMNAKKAKKAALKEAADK